ncbi:SLATT domain-containing protein [Phreatobacter cathodiphilus]|uniref:SLATT domain-containing protein n=1 Tax=Phreatobacter cathodiphilus TaxID=1868589 RepID=UPI0011B259A5|nr:SLATT domain-containing protein [Phreatobacter cathodiphilus]
MSSETPPVGPLVAASDLQQRLTDTAERYCRYGRMTAGAQFEAGRRHKSASRTSNLSIVILSTWVFSASVVLLVFDATLNPTAKSALVSMSMIFSFFVVAFSLLEASKRHEVRSELFLQSARAIGEICKSLEINILLNKVTAENIDKFNVDYHRALTRIHDNHAEMDFQIHRMRTSKSTVDTTTWRGYFTYLRRFYWRLIFQLYIWQTVLMAFIAPVAAFCVLYVLYTSQYLTK